MILAIFISIIIIVCIKIFSSPFPDCPKFVKIFDVSGKRKPDLNEYIEDYLNKSGLVDIEAHKSQVQQWKCNCEEYIATHKFKKLRTHQYLQMPVEDDYKFQLIKKQTRYRQENYQKYSYTVDVIVSYDMLSYSQLQEKYNQLAEINFETTLKKYHSKKQRSLMTSSLRNQIKLRDNYTCQVCGKQMLDEVGLQIDHIVPISKGGKTVKSNLQVLCSKCNSSKYNKLV